MKCPCRGCTDRTMTCHCDGQCERWEQWKEYDKDRKAWLEAQKPISSETMRKRANENIRRKARGWKRSAGGEKNA